MITLRRGVVGKHRGVDVTAKSAEGMPKLLAPPWHLVMQAKRKQITWEVYRQRYLLRLNHVDVRVIEPHLTADSSGGDLWLLCYCPLEKEHCHVDVLIDYLVAVIPDVYRREDIGSAMPDLSFVSG
jgi:uncharacterized protein YeaO (DUF488 family)